MIDHAGYLSTAAGEVAGGRYAQAVITSIDGVGKVATSFVGAALRGTRASPPANACVTVSKTPPSQAPTRASRRT